MKEVGYGKDADYVSRNTVNQPPTMLIYSCTWSEGFGVRSTSNVYFLILYYYYSVPFVL